MDSFEKLSTIISDVLGEKVELTLDTDLLADLNLNSLDIVEIIVKIEEEFDVSVSDRTIRSIKTVADILRLLE